MTDARLALTTITGTEPARNLARQLVELHLAACVNIVDGVHSIYRWQGAVESAEELLLMIKTSATRLPALKEAIARLHPYDLPELIVLEIGDGSDEYLTWLLAASEKVSKLP